MVFLVLIHTNLFYRHFESKFRPLQPCLGLRTNNANLLGECGRLILLGLVPNTTKPLKNYYGRILLELKHTKIPQKLNGLSITSFLQVTQVCTTLANF